MLDRNCTNGLNVEDTRLKIAPIPQCGRRTGSRPHHVLDAPNRAPRPLRSVKGHIHRRETVNTKGQTRVRWYTIVDIPRGPDGRRRQKWHGGFATRREAELARADVLSRLARGTYVERSSLLVSEWVLGTWLGTVETQLKPSTFHSYRRNLELHLLPRLGHLRFGDLTPARITESYAELLRSGRQRGRSKGEGLSPTTVRYLHAILHRALADAVTAGLLESNPASLVKLPRSGLTLAPELRCWSADELSAFLRQTDHLPLSLAWRLAAMTGMRRGEVLGLRWKDVSVADRRLQISRSLVVVDGSTRESTPKNGHARSIDLDAGTATLLHALRPRDGGGDSRVVVGSDGASPSPGSLSRAFRSAVAVAGVPMIRFHDLRHTHATLSLAAGVPVRVVADRLGHASAAFTLRRYAHVLPGMQAAAAETFASLLGGELPA